MTGVVFAHTVVNPDTVVVHFGDAFAADAAMLASCWFYESAGSAFISWEEKHKVVGVC